MIILGPIASMKAPLLGFSFFFALLTVDCIVDYDEAERFLEKFENFHKTPKVSNNEIQNHVSLLPSFIKAVKNFQKYAGLPITGKLDDASMEMMRKPRCGNPDGENDDDLNDSEKPKKRKRFATASKWRRKSLTYYIKTPYPNDQLTRQEVNDAIDKAFKYWSDVSDLTFQKVSSEYADIIMLFARGSHGDGNPFDGPGKVLAHAYFPQNGDVHFDDDENFTLNTYTGTNLLQIATHEIGHSLGLQHSDARNAVMAPYYYGYNPNFALDQDDIDGIRSLYGYSKVFTPPIVKTTIKTVKSSVKPTVNSYPDPCSLSSIDTFFESLDGYFYVFKGAYYWKVNRYGDLMSRIPQKISDGFPGLPNDIDAAFMWRTKSTYFFKGDLYWRFRGGVMQKGFPKKIGIQGFRGVPTDLSTAFVYKGNSVIYFTKGNLYYRYENYRVRSGYPKSFDRIWSGAPANIDAALAFSNNYNYFFKGNVYYRFNPHTFSVDSGYPRNTGQWWFRCNSANTENGSSSSEMKDGSSMSEKRETENDQRELEGPNNLEIDEDSLSKAPVIHFSILSLSSLLFLKFIF